MAKNDDWKKDPELFDQKTGREIAASGYPAPTTDEAIHELGIITDLLERHGCATTRDLISAASVVVDVAHKDAHSHTPEKLQTDMVEFAVTAFGSLQTEINDKVATIEKLEDKAKFFARMTSILLQVARVTGANSLNLIKQALDAEKATFQTSSVINVNSPEEAIKNLLDIPVKNTYKM